MEPIDFPESNKVCERPAWWGRIKRAVFRDAINGVVIAEVDATVGPDGFVSTPEVRISMTWEDWENVALVCVACGTEIGENDLHELRATRDGDGPTVRSRRCNDCSTYPFRPHTQESADVL